MKFFNNNNQPIINKNFLTSMEHIHREMSDFFEKQSPKLTNNNPQKEDFYNPQVDIKETNNFYKIEMEVPGLKPENIDVSFLDNTLIIQGEKKAVEEVPVTNGYSHTERSFGQFYRAFPLAHNIDPIKTSAIIKHGVLKIKIEKVPGEHRKTKRIKVTD